MPRIALIDTYYPAFLKSWPFDTDADYQRELDLLLEFGFGTGDFYARNLRACGWETLDIVANSAALQEKWLNQHWAPREDWNLERIALAQIKAFNPDVVFLQDLSWFSDAAIESLGERFLLAGQLSCPWPGDNRVRQMDVLFTSFPHYVGRFKKLGVKEHYLPLAFEPDMLRRFTQGPRDIELAFVGGVGTPSHWSYGLAVLETVAKEIPEARFYGYGYSTLPKVSALRAKHHGEAWGIHMYSILSRAKIMLNRHGEVAENSANNLRMYEATGCGALLLTEEKDNIRDLFAADEIATYRSPGEAVEKARYYLEHWDEGAEIAKRGQARTLKDHTYKNRMPQVVEAFGMFHHSV